ncbi:membrane fusion protein (multidrug efflux system) [Constrictibacter sp. MBR-5]|jgi:RND family efflux transporter MFP subunit|uniref:efflux RND transporter periplasmic adaptor subunit n=1 Tax=Constrictibacter sp. MBR-5 TaxID=3156467 RepID=UPI003392E006
MRRDDARSASAHADGGDAQDENARTTEKRSVTHPPRRILGLIVALAVVAGGAYLAYRAIWSEQGGEQQQSRPPVTVAAARAESETWRTRLTSVGSLQAVNGVDVTTEVAGIVSEISFESGQSVSRGDLLAQLIAETDRAQLASLQAQLQQARSDLARNRRLVGRGAIARREVEQAETSVESLRAQTRERQEAIGKKRIEAPFDGELGIRRVNLGQYLSPGQAVVTLQSIAPIHVNFTLPEQHYGRTDAGIPLEIRVDAYPDRVFEGRINATSPDVDAETRNFSIQGILPNRDRLLRPGMFAEIAIVLPDRREVVTLPATAISYNPYGDAVYMIAEASAETASSSSGPQGQAGSDGDGGVLTWLSDLFGGDDDVSAPAEEDATHQARNGPPRIAKRVFVELGERRDTKVAVANGVEVGDLVVTAGQLKLDDGAPIVVSDDDVLEMAPAKPAGP